MVRTLLLVLGALSPVVYIAADVVCGLRYPNYSFAHQVISELSAVGAPTAALWGAFLQVYAFLFTAFTTAIVLEGRTRPQVRVLGWLMVAFVLSGPLWSFVPMHQRGDAFAVTDAGHIAMGALMVLLLTATMFAGTNALGNRFRRFSRLVTPVAFLFGLGTFVYVPLMIWQRPTPGVGVVERVFLYAFLLWSGVLAVGLLHARNRTTPPDVS